MQGKQQQVHLGIFAFMLPFLLCILCLLSKSIVIFYMFVWGMSLLETILLVAVLFLLSMIALVLYYTTEKYWANISLIFDFVSFAFVTNWRTIMCLTDFLLKRRELEHNEAAASKTAEKIRHINSEFTQKMKNLCEEADTSIKHLLGEDVFNELHYYLQTQLLSGSPRHDA